MPRPLSLSLSLSLPLLLLVACSGSSQVVDGGAQLAEAAGDVPAAACRFAGLGDPSSLPAGTEIINAPSERLTAPASGLWWIAEPLDDVSVVAQGEGGAPIELQVVKRELFVPDRPLATLRVPPSLPAGARLQLAGRELVVGEPGEPIDLASVTVDYTYRPDLGGTGVTARLPSSWRGRVFVADAYVGLPFANVQAGIHVIEELLLADAPSLCDVTTSPDPTEVFVPMWMGQIKPEESFYLLLVDADDFQRRRPVRVPL